MGSINSAIQSLSAQLGLTSEEAEAFRESVINGAPSDPIFNLVSEKAKSIDSVEDFILQGLSDIHDNWVKDNSGEQAFQKKTERQQLRQYAPLEIIGWNEAKSDLLFLTPILSSIGVPAPTRGLEGLKNLKKLENAYYEKLSSFLAEKGTNLTELVSRGKDFYPALPDELAQKIVPIAGTVANQIVDNWKSNDKSSMQVFDSAMDHSNEATNDSIENENIIVEYTEEPAAVTAEQEQSLTGYENLSEEELLAQQALINEEINRRNVSQDYSPTR